MSSNFKVEKDAETGKFKVYNKRKQTYSKRMFASKESATKMCSVYDNLGKKKQSTSNLEKVIKEVDVNKPKKNSPPVPKKPRVKKGVKTEDVSE